MSLKIAAASLLSITSFLHADSCATCPEIKPAGACSQPFVPAANPCSLGVINPHARPHIDCARATVTLEGLLWTAHLDGLQYAIQNTEAANLAATQVSLNHSSPFYNADLLHPKSKWDYGYRLGLGYDLTHDGWDLYAGWTHLRTTATQHVEIDLQLVPHRIYALYTAVVPGTENALGVSDLRTTAITVNPTADSLDTRWKLHFDLIDLELGREFYTSRYLTLRPHIGLRGASVRQKYDIDYMGGTLHRNRDSPSG